MNMGRKAEKEKEGEKVEEEEIATHPTCCKRTVDLNCPIHPNTESRRVEEEVEGRVREGEGGDGSSTYLLDPDRRHYSFSLPLDTRNLTDSGDGSRVN